MQGDDFVDATMANLKIISMLQKNDKIRVHKGNISIDRGDGAVQAIRRWLNRDSRDVTLIHLRNTITNAIRIARSLSDTPQHSSSQRHVRGMKDWTLQRLVGEMAAAEMGLQNLRATYMMDSGIVAAVDVLTERLRANCEAFMDSQADSVRVPWRPGGSTSRGMQGIEEDVPAQSECPDEVAAAPEDEMHANFSRKDNLTGGSTSPLALKTPHPRRQQSSSR